MKLTRAVFLALLALLLIAVALRVFVDKPSESDMAALKDDGAFIPGVSVNGVDISGMSYRDARAAVLPSVEAALRSISITVMHGSEMWILTGADTGAVSTLDSVLTEAIGLGRGGTVIENGEVRADVEANGRDFAVTFIPDELTLSARLAQIGVALDTLPTEPAASADFTAAEPAFTYSEGSDGYMLDEAAFYDEIAALLASGTYTATLTPELEYVSPTLTLEDIKAVTMLRSTFQTSFGGSRAARNEKRVGNIQKAITMLNGARVEPGAEFNFNAFIGPRTERGGWPLAPGIVNGNQYEDQAGGGICQVSTTLYNALLCAGASMQRGSTLEEVLAANIAGISITERRHHTWPSSYVDKGLDSTVTGTVEDGKSLNFVNNTASPLFIFAYCDPVNYLVTVYIYGEPLPEGITYQVRGVEDEVLVPEAELIQYDTTLPLDYNEVDVVARNGFKATAWRDTYLNGEFQSSEELYQDTYRPVQGTRIVGTGGAAAPTPTQAP